MRQLDRVPLGVRDSRRACGTRQLLSSSHCIAAPALQCSLVVSCYPCRPNKLLPPPRRHRPACLPAPQKALLEELSGGSAPLRSLRQLGWDLGPQQTLALFHEQLSDVVGTNVQVVPMVTSSMFQSAADLVQVVKEFVEDGKGLPRVEQLMLTVSEWRLWVRRRPLSRARRLLQGVSAALVGVALAGSSGPCQDKPSGKMNGSRFASCSHTVAGRHTGSAAGLPPSWWLSPLTYYCLAAAGVRRVVVARLLHPCPC